MRTLKNLAVAAALIGLAAPVRAEYYPGSTDLEGDDPLSGDLWGNAGEAEVVADASVASVPRSANLPPSFDETRRTNVLSVDAEEPVVRYLQAGQEAPSASTVYADFLVKGCPLVHDAELQQPDSADMILVYARISQGGDATNLCVYAKDGNGTAREFVLTKTIGADEWHRIVIKASSEGYQIYCDGVEEADLCKTADGADTFYALNAGDPMAGVGFTGTGRVDDLVLSSPDPALPVYTLAWGEGFESVSFTTNGIAGAALAAADGEYRFQAPEGLAVVLTGDTGYRTIVVSGTGTSSAISLPGVSGIAKYFPQSATAGQDGSAANPYEIPDIAALNALKGAVLETNCANLCFVQTDDIDFNGEPAFGGIGVYNNAKVGDIEAGDPRGGTPFSGTYDGQGHRISNIAFESKTYAGVFNQVNGGTIRNLAVENATGSKGISIVGNAGNGATLQNLVAEGTFGSAAVPANHNAAGIAIRLSAGGAGTLVKDCTNNATIYGTYTKLGGICTLTEARVSGGAVTFDGCVNNGDLMMPSGSTAGRDGLAGIVAYSADTTILTNCANTAAEISSTLADAKIGELVGYAYAGYTLTDLGGNSGDAEKAFVFEQAGTINGFKYATVENGVATTIPPPYTPAAGNTYLLVGDVAASETPVATLAAGQTVAFDEGLGYTFEGTVAAEDWLLVSSSTVGSVTTYTVGSAWFPRTATPGQEGTAANPFEIEDVDDIQALKAAIAADAAYRAYNYKVVADIDATDLGYWDGIGDDETANSGLDGGTLDGDGHTIGNLKFSTGRYRGFFNRMDDATIKNLTIHVADIQETEAAEHGYAAFVGNMKNSKLADCVATGTIGTAGRPSMHTSAGFAVKVDSGGVFVNCTNHINIVCSLTNNPKIGGIVGHMQGGALTNCWNDGDITITCKTCANAGNGAGGLIGYAQSSAVTIHHCGNAGTIRSTDTTGNDGAYDIYVGTIIGKLGSSAAYITGGTVAQADAAPAGYRSSVGGAAGIFFGLIHGLDFATVDNNVATFVSDLESNNTYKVMLTGATATYNFAAPGTIAFDQSLYTPAYAITAAEGLDLTNDAGSPVITFAAAAASPSYYDPQGALIEDSGVVSWLSTNGFTQAQIDALGNTPAGTDRLYACWLLNLNFTVPDASATIGITNITVGNRVSMTVQLVRKAPLAGRINGALYIYGANNLAAGFSRSPIPDESVEYFTGDPTFDLATATGDTVTQTAVATLNNSVTYGDSAKFFKATIEVPWVDNGEEFEPGPEEP